MASINACWLNHCLLLSATCAGVLLESSCKGVPVCKNVEKLPLVVASNACCSWQPSTLAKRVIDMDTCSHCNALGCCWLWCQLGSRSLVVFRQSSRPAEMRASHEHTALHQGKLTSVQWVGVIRPSTCMSAIAACGCSQSVALSVEGPTPQWPVSGSEHRVGVSRAMHNS